MPRSFNKKNIVEPDPLISVSPEYDVLSVIKPGFGHFIHRFYPKELKMRKTTNTIKSVSYLGRLLEVDEEE